jgi:S-adenosylmethionine hydrolase
VTVDSRPLITLLTDFGEGSPYVAAMKAVMLRTCPSVTIVDVSHAVQPQAVEEAAFVLAMTASFFPRGTIHVAVVDPGVGTQRLPIAIETADATFVGPDNGVLSAALGDAARPPASEASAPQPVPVGGLRAVQLTNPAYFRPEISATFHGRGIFAPVAAWLAGGLPLAECGPPVDAMLAFPAWRARRSQAGEFAGRAVYIDHFGNIITTVRTADLGAQPVELEIAGRRFTGLQANYQEGPEYIVYGGSSGFVEVGRRNGNAALALGVRPGDPVFVRPDRQP